MYGDGSKGGRILSELTKFEKWVDIYGAGRLARELDITKQVVTTWLRIHQRPSDNFKIKIVALSNGVIEFRDFFPNREA